MQQIYIKFICSYEIRGKWNTGAMLKMYLFLQTHYLSRLKEILCVYTHKVIVDNVITSLVIGQGIWAVLEYTTSMYFNKKTLHCFCKLRKGSQPTCCLSKTLTFHVENKSIVNILAKNVKTLHIWKIPLATKRQSACSWFENSFKIPLGSH